jgi:hypothetical protein
MGMYDLESGKIVDTNTAVQVWQRVGRRLSVSLPRRELCPLYLG